jgi:hypothetical protein
MIARIGFSDLVVGSAVAVRSREQTMSDGRQAGCELGESPLTIEELFTGIENRYLSGPREKYPNVKRQRSGNARATEHSHRRVAISVFAR